MNRRLQFNAAVLSLEGEESRVATFYLMNTGMNRNRWGVTDAALEDALPSVLGKPIGCGPGYTIDGHSPDPMNLGTFIGTEKPDGYALGSAEITDGYAWSRLTGGDWGPISVVIHSTRETCSSCGMALTDELDPWSHSCVSSGEGYVQVERFTFNRVDFVDVPAYPMAGVIHQPTTFAPLTLPAGHQFGGFSRSIDGRVAGNPGTCPDPLEEERRKMKQEELQSRVNELEQQLSNERQARMEVESNLTAIQADRHTEHVEKTLKARRQAGLVPDAEAERGRLKGYTVDVLKDMQTDAERITRTRSGIGHPKARNSGAQGGELKAAIEDARRRLFGSHREGDPQ